MNAENKIAELEKQIEELTDKHWEECRQIALYDDELKNEYTQGYEDGLRSKALEELIPTFEKMGVTFSETLKDIAKTLIDRMSIEVDMRRHGGWIIPDNGEYAECSECKGRSGTQFDGVEPIPLMTRYCPHCGAIMKRKENNNASNMG